MSVCGTKESLVNPILECPVVEVLPRVAVSGERFRDAANRLQL
jgi:hypothetical protein